MLPIVTNQLKKLSIVHTEQLEGKEILVAGNVSYEECIVLFETENFTKIKKFENKQFFEL